MERLKFWNWRRAAIVFDSQRAVALHLGTERPPDRVTFRVGSHVSWKNLHLNDRARLCPHLAQKTASPCCVGCRVLFPVCGTCALKATRKVPQRSGWIGLFPSLARRRRKSVLRSWTSASFVLRLGLVSGMTCSVAGVALGRSGGPAAAAVIVTTRAPLVMAAIH